MCMSKKARILLCAAAALLALALRPLVFQAEKTQKIKRETKRFYTTAMKIQEQTEPEKEVPYEQLLQDLQTYNKMAL